jgi:hypothetical protein
MDEEEDEEEQMDGLARLPQDRVPGSRPSSTDIDDEEELHPPTPPEYSERIESPSAYS